jgi:P-type E1-E2 ATPase
VNKTIPLDRSHCAIADESDVGYMGDGINDAAAVREADVGISVDTAADIAKESADIILDSKHISKS